MPNPPTSATYGMLFNGTSTTLTLNFDSQFNIVNSSMGANPISGSFNATTGEITFVEHPPHFLPTSFPVFEGFFFLSDMDPGVAPPTPTFAGVFDQTVLVATGTPPNLILQWQHIESGWFALKQ